MLRLESTLRICPLSVQLGRRDMGSFGPTRLIHAMMRYPAAETAYLDMAKEVVP